MLKLELALLRFIAIGFWKSLQGIKNLFVFSINVTRDIGVPNLKGRSSQVLEPGDRTPSHGIRGDYLDYRGTAREKELGALRESGIWFGRFRSPSGHSRSRLHLPVPLLTRNCAVIGPPGSGKTEGIILPWIEGLLKEGNSVVTCDIKGDLVDRLMPVARQIGCRFWYWNCADPARSLAWNWFDEIGEMRDIEAATLSILGRPNLNDAQPYFYERDYRWLRTLIDIVKTAYKGTAIPQYLYTLVGDQNALRALFGQAPKIQSKAGELADLLQFSIDEHSRAVSGLLNSLHLFNLQHVLDVTNRSDFALDDIDKSPTLLIIGASLADARVAEVLSGMMLNQLFNKVYRRFANPRHPGRRSLFFVIDEAPRLKQRIKFDEVLSVSRSADVGICLAAQDVNQFGEEREYTAILANCLSFIAMRGSSIDTARYLSGRLGQRQEQAVGTSTNRGPVDLFSHSGTTRSSVSVPVIGEREIMHPPGSVYTATAHISPVSPKPFLVDLTR